MPAILSLIIKLLPTLVGLAELIFNRPKAGAEKREWVLGVANTIMQGTDTALTGGAAATWDRIQPLVGQIVDASAAIAFPPVRAPGQPGEGF